MLSVVFCSLLCCVLLCWLSLCWISWRPLEQAQESWRSKTSFQHWDQAFTFRRGAIDQQLQLVDELWAEVKPGLWNLRDACWLSRFRAEC